MIGVNLCPGEEYSASLGLEALQAGLCLTPSLPSTFHLPPPISCKNPRHASIEIVRMTFCVTTLDSLSQLRHSYLLQTCQFFLRVVFCKQLTSVKKVLNWICRHLKSSPFSHQGMLHHTDLRMWFLGMKLPNLSELSDASNSTLKHAVVLRPFKTNSNKSTLSLNLK